MTPPMSSGSGAYRADGRRDAWAEVSGKIIWLAVENSPAIRIEMGLLPNADGPVDSIELSSGVEIRQSEA